MAMRIFAVKDKTTNQVTGLVKAETRGQVKQHLVAKISIEPVSALDLADLMTDGNLKVETASISVAPADGDGDDGGGESGREPGSDAGAS